MIIYRWKAGHPVFLTIKHQQGHWGFPKGHAEGKEKPLEAANREVAEEVGLTELKPEKGVTFQEKYAFRIWGKKIHKVVTFWLAETDQSDIQVQQAEIESYKWVTLAEGLELITFEAGKTVLTEAAGYLEKK
jgi:8-oxo-dGTP pyrophosphatase MutT (NUDIX family)